MSGFFYLIPVSLILGALGLVVFLWSLRDGQYEDLDGAAQRILYDEDEPAESSALVIEPVSGEGGDAAGFVDVAGIARNAHCAQQFVAAADEDSAR